MSDPRGSVSRRELLRDAGGVLALSFLRSSVLSAAAAGGTADSALVQPETAAGTYAGRWHGPKCYVGFHYDLHVIDKDTDIGARCEPKELAAMLRLAGADYVQTDSKGHPGLTSWFSKTPGASVGRGVSRDWVLAWRQATKELGVPLHCHYSGIWDISAGAKHPEWCMVGSDGKPPVNGIAGMTSAGGERITARPPRLMTCPASRWR